MSEFTMPTRRLIGFIDWYLASEVRLLAKSLDTVDPDVHEDNMREAEGLLQERVLMIDDLLGRIGGGE